MSAERPAWVDSRAWLVAEASWTVLIQAAVALGRPVASQLGAWPSLALVHGLGLVFLLSYALAAGAQARGAHPVQAAPARWQRTGRPFGTAHGIAANALLPPRLWLASARLLAQVPATWLCALQQHAMGVEGIRRRLTAAYRRRAGGQGMAPAAGAVGATGATGRRRVWRSLLLHARWTVSRTWTSPIARPCPPPQGPPPLPRLQGHGTFVLLGSKGAAYVLEDGAGGRPVVIAQERGLRALALRGLAVRRAVPVVEHVALSARLRDHAAGAPLPPDCALVLAQMARWLDRARSARQRAGA